MQGLRQPSVAKAGSRWNPACFGFLLVWSSLVLVGCANVPIPLVYKLDIQQGNVLDENMLARLELGMEKRKVRFLLGTPLISDTFNADRWDYVYTFQEGRRTRERRHVVVVFENDRLLRLEGDVAPGVMGLEVEQHPDELVSVPDHDSGTLFGNLGGVFGGDETRVPRKKNPKPVEPEGVEEQDGGESSSPLLDDEGEATEAVRVEPPIEPDEPEIEVVGVVPSDAGAAPLDEPADASEAPAESEEEGFFARLTKRLRGEDSEKAIPSSEEESVGELSGGQGADEYSNNVTPAADTASLDGGAKESFFTRLKKRFGGADEDEDEDEPAETEATTAQDEEGFFERLSEKFGLDPPPQTPRGGNQN